MHTKDILAEALRQAGLPDMATKAAEGYYHDFLSPLPLPEKQLMHDLQVAKKLSKDERQIDKIRILLERHLNGAFDASNEESEEWAKSKEGREAFKELVRKPGRKKKP